MIRMRKLVNDVKFNSSANADKRCSDDDDDYWGLLIAKLIYPPLLWWRAGKEVFFPLPLSGDVGI